MSNSTIRRLSSMPNTALIHELERVRFVMKGGQVVKNELASH
jgi:hypothetical protein